jgi:outer membrane protein OmpA-like peptidoglycan-associated protein
MALKKTIVGLSTATLMALLMSSTVSAHDGKNVSTGHADGILKDRWGNCVVSVSGNELCNKVAPPAPKPAVCRDVKTCRTIPTNVTIQKNLAGDTNFKFDKSTLTAAGQAELTTMIGSLRGINVANINIAGHTDAVGSESYNLGLSKRRAKSVANFLVSNGVNGSKITAQGFGESQATLPSSASNAARMADRRVDITIKGVTTGKGKGRQVCSTKKVCTK